MREVGILMRLELRELYGWNKYRFTKDQKEKNRYRVLIGAFALLAVMLCGYVAGLVYGLAMLGLAQIVPSYLVMLSSILILVFGIFKTGSRLLSTHGYDILVSMPLNGAALPISRFAALYLEELPLTLAVMLPGCVTYGVLVKPSVVFYPVALLATLLIPAIPLVLSGIFGTLLAAISARTKHKSLAQSVIAVLFVLAVLVLSLFLPTTLEELSIEQMTQLASVLGESIGRMYPPALWLGNAMTGSAWMGLLAAVAVSVAMTAIFLLLLAQNFNRIIRGLLTVSAKHDYRMGALSHRGLLKALYVKEAKRYFASSIYVMNTVISPILAVAMSVGALFLDLDGIAAALPLNLTPARLAPFLLSCVLCMMNTTSVAVSMEGKQIWITQSLPIPTKAWLDGKLLWNLTLTLPAALLSSVLLSIAVKPSLEELFWMLVLPLVMILFSAVLGLTVNLKLHSFDWQKEETVVKQSASAALGGLSGALIALILLGITVITPTPMRPITEAAVCVVLLALTALLYRQNNRAKISTL